MIPQETVRGQALGSAILGTTGAAMMAEFGLLGVPSNTAAHGPGQEKAPAALRRAGLPERLTAAGMGIVDHGDAHGAVAAPPAPAPAPTTSKPARRAPQDV